MNNYRIQSTTFWKFLEGHKIEIPIIQRDYAQGRIGKEKLREKFLNDLKDALDNNKSLKLDFVYGSIENGNLNPLDGQQRLTTLWLLHWYIAFRADKLLDDKIKERFKKFTYETRISSREFCEKLSDFIPVHCRNNNIVELIENQTWFYSVWKQDPTIQAMLHMLGGTTIKDKKGNEIFDGIEEVFKDCDYNAYWMLLVSDESPIRFYYLDLLGLKLTDDLYIKMNARGKGLTDFENFKADLVGHIKELGFEENEAPENTIAHKLDTVWTDIFWKFRSENNNIDEIYFSFINRHILNYLIVAEGTKNGYLFSQEEIELQKLFKYLYGNKGNDSQVKYESLEVYKNDLSGENLKKYLIKLSSTLDNFHSSFHEKSKEEISALFYPAWDRDSNFRFIPEYSNVKDKNNNNSLMFTTLEQKPRIIFYAICAYFENGYFEEKTFKRWMRIVWNIVENTDIDKIPSMVGVMRLIDELKVGSHDVYTYLTNNKMNSAAAEVQVKEEKEKAKQIFNDTTNAWESKIIEAENFAFFKGTVRFLFRTGINEYDWNKFEPRFEKVKEYFDRNGTQEKYTKEAVLLRFLISNFSKWEQFWNFNYDNTSSNWKNLLTNDKWNIPVSSILDNNISDFTNWIPMCINLNETQTMLHKELVLSPLLDIIEKRCVLNWRFEKFCLYPTNAHAERKKYVVADLRNEVLSDLVNDCVISSDQKINSSKFFWGWDIEFKHVNTGKKYVWTRWNFLHSVTDEGKWDAKIDIENGIKGLKEYLRSQS